MEDIKLTKMICSWIFHDMASSVGAIINGFELIENLPNNPTLRDQSILLIQDSAKELSVKLKFFRIIFSNVQTSYDKISISEINNDITAFFRIKRVLFSFNVANDLIDQQFLRLSLSLCAALSDLSINGGKINMYHSKSDKNNKTDTIHLKLSGKRLKSSESLVSLFTNNEVSDVIDSSMAISLFAQRLAITMGAAINITATNDKVDIIAIV